VARVLFERGQWRAWLMREPLIAFVLIAIPLYFVVPRTEDPKRIVMPLGALSNEAVQSQLREEILRREALRLGLDATPEVRSATAAALRMRIAQGQPRPSREDLERLKQESRHPAPLWVKITLQAEGDARASTPQVFAGLVEQLTEQHGAAVRDAALRMGIGETQRVPTAHGDRRVQLIERRSAGIDEAPGLRAQLEQAFLRASTDRAIDDFVRRAATGYTVESEAAGRASRRPASGFLSPSGAP
jgi:hypothetical protein